MGVTVQQAQRAANGKVFHLERHGGLAVTGVPEPEKSMDPAAVNLQCSPALGQLCLWEIHGTSSERPGPVYEKMREVLASPGG